MYFNIIICYYHGTCLGKGGIWSYLMCYGNACRKKIIHLKTCTVWYVFTNYLLTTLKKMTSLLFFY